MIEELQTAYWEGYKQALLDNSQVSNGRHRINGKTYQEALEDAQRSQEQGAARIFFYNDSGAAEL